MKKKLIGLGIISIILVNVFVNINYQNGDIDLNLLNANASKYNIEVYTDGQCYQWMDYITTTWSCEDNPNLYSGIDQKLYYCSGYSQNMECRTGTWEREWLCGVLIDDWDMTSTSVCW